MRVTIELSPEMEAYVMNGTEDTKLSPAGVLLSMLEFARDEDEGGQTAPTTSTDQ